MEPDAHPCAVAERGLLLREICASCTGRPRSGQRRLSRGDVLCNEGGEADTVFLVVEGLLRESIVDQEGRIGGCRALGPGEIVGVEALGGGDYRATVDALSPSRVCEIPAASVRARLRAVPEQGLTLATILADDVAGLRERLASQATLPAEERVEGLLRQLIGDEPGDGWVRLPLTREQMGQFLGLTLETVSRIVQRLSRRGLIELKGRRVRFASSGADHP